MRKPEKIKKSLDACGGFRGCTNCGYYRGPSRGQTCISSVMLDALEYINELEKRLADVNASPFDGGMSQQEYLNGEEGDR